MMNRYRLTLLAMALGATALTWGVPAKPGVHTFTQPDGSIITLRLAGDENCHFYIDSESRPVELGHDGFWHPADPGVERPVPRKSRRRASDRPDTTFPCTGSPRALVLLVDYTDVPFVTPDAQVAFSRMLNEEGYSELGATGSARDWFADNSMGEFTPIFDVVGPVHLNHPRAYYGANKGGEDAQAELMVIEACTLLDDEIDFSIYDADKDGFIDNVFLFYAGYGENLGGAAGEDCVWPHSWDIVDATSVPYIFDGVRLNHYACTNEIDLTDTMDGIGTFVHEFSHVLGLPDLYATNYSYAFTPGKWSVMDEGPYNNNSRTPPYYSAFERYSLGWLEPVELDGPAKIKLDNISSNRACVVRTDRENEYFMIENRQHTGWDTYLPHHGMLVWHIDYNENVWRYNTVNDRKDHQYVDIVEADGVQHDDNRDGDPFPGARNITAFADDTEPAMRTWEGTPCGVPLTDIFESNGFIYFNVCGGKETVTPTETLAATDVATDAFTAHWNPGEPGCSHILTVYSVEETDRDGKPQVRITYVEGFDNLNTGDAVSIRVTGLKPDTEYRYTVRVRDNVSEIESVASNETVVTTLPPTFADLAPVVSQAAEVTATSFTAQWEPMEEAEAYELSVYTKELGDPLSVTCGFDAGTGTLPEGWRTNSRLTYGAESYCGESVPSLRFNAEGQYLEGLVPGSRIRGLQMWHRGVGGDSSELSVMARQDDNWTEVDRFVPDDAGGVKEWNAAEWPYGADGFRIVFHPSAKGSVAVDDVMLLHGGEETRHPLDGLDLINVGAVTSFEVTGLSASTEYFYTVRALNAEAVSRGSAEVRVLTQSDSGVTSLPGEGVRVRHMGGTLTIEGLADGEAVTVMTPQGLTVARGVSNDGVCTLAPAPSAVWIVRCGGRTFKVRGL